jgi:hypothetical protein
MRPIRLAARSAAIIACALGLIAAQGARAAESPATYCRLVGTDDTLRPLPPSLVPQFQRAFGAHMPAEYAERSGYIRCDNGIVLGCTVGANLPCGPADTRRDIPGADAWCRRNHDPDMIPAYVTGHASIYAWRCAGGRAVPVRQVAHVDNRGFVAEYWRRLD